MKKRILSFVLAISMLCGLSVFGANAAEPAERVLNDFDTIGRVDYVGPNNQGFTGSMSTIDYTAIDPDYQGGQVARIYGKDAVNYGNWNLNLDPSWAADGYDTPVAIKFQMWSDVPVEVSNNSGFTADMKASWTPSDLKTSFKQCGITENITTQTTPTWYTFDISDIAVPYSSRLGMKLQVSVGVYNLYIDNVTLVYEPLEGRTANFDLAGVDPIQVDAEGKVTLPEATLQGTNLLGWIDDKDNIYPAGATIRLSKTTEFKAVTSIVELQTGAGIRWAELEQERGIRFETYVSKAALDTLGSSRFEIGALILPYEKYDDGITVENAAEYTAVNVADPKVYGEIGDNYRYYCGVVDFEKYFDASQAALADMKMTAVSYLKVMYSDGTVKYFYDRPDAADNVRTVSEIARAALADTSFGYTARQIEILKLYDKYSNEETIPEYRKDIDDNPNALSTVGFLMTECTLKADGGSFQEHDNGEPINDYTADGAQRHYVVSPFQVGKTITIKLPEEIKKGSYKVSFNTRGYNTRAFADVDVSSTLGAGGKAAENLDFNTPDANARWWEVTCPTAVDIGGETTITLTSTQQNGMYIYSVVLTPVR
jgi:hypothetical protein